MAKTAGVMASFTSAPEKGWGSGGTDIYRIIYT